MSISYTETILSIKKKFQDFQGPSNSNSRTFKDVWEPWSYGSMGCLSWVVSLLDRSFQLGGHSASWQPTSEASKYCTASETE